MPPVGTSPTRTIGGPGERVMPPAPGSDGTGRHGPPEVRPGVRPPAVSTVVGAGLAAWGLLVGIRPLDDNSFLTHLTTGRLIVASGSVPRADPYSFTAKGDPWVVQSWLASAVLGAIDQLVGLVGVRLLFGVTAAVLMAVVWRLTRPAGSLGGRLLVGALVGAVGAGMWSERPYLFGLLLLGLTLLVAEGDVDPRWLVPGMWIWVNVHGSFPLGFALLACLAVGRRLDGERAAVELAAGRWAVLGLALGALNPLGPRLLVFPIGPLLHRERFSGIIEWQAPTFGPASEKLFLVQLAVAALLLGRHRRWRVAIPAVVFVAAALTSLRNVPVASLVLVPGMAIGARGLGSVGGDARNRATAMAAGALAAVALVAGVTTLRQPATDLADYPVAATTWMAGRGMLGPDARVFAPDIVGNYLGYRFGPGRSPVFIDDRVDMFPVSLVRDYFAVVHADRSWEAVVRRHRIDAVLWRRASPLGRQLSASAGWRTVHRAGGWIVAVPVPAPPARPPPAPR